MPKGEKILITGPASQVALPIARSLAEHNEVHGLARFGRAADRERLEAFGVRCIPFDVERHIVNDEHNLSGASRPVSSLERPEHRANSARDTESDQEQPEPKRAGQDMAHPTIIPVAYMMPNPRESPANAGREAMNSRSGR